jgi:hypothetical protein
MKLMTSNARDSKSEEKEERLGLTCLLGDIIFFPAMFLIGMPSYEEAVSHRWPAFLPYPLTYRARYNTDYVPLFTFITSFRVE